MAAMASKFNFECVIQYYTDQWLAHLEESNLLKTTAKPLFNVFRLGEPADIHLLIPKTEL